MCGRYTLLTPEMEREIRAIVREAEQRAKERNSRNVKAVLQTEGQVCPTQLAPILMPETGRFGSVPAFWGFTNSHDTENRKRALEGKKPLKPSPVFNTRGDRAETSPMWRDSFRQRRCVIPCTSFYEWKHEIKTKPGEAKKDKGVEYHFTMPGDEVLYIAGIWQNEVDVATGEVWPHFSMLTTEPAEAVMDIHDRMPVVLLRHELDQWIDGDYKALLNRDNIHLDKKIA